LKLETVARYLRPSKQAIMPPGSEAVGTGTATHPLGFSQLDTVVRIEHSLSGSAAYVDVNRFMVVAVEKGNKSVFF
jgi:hypothetical protein